MLQFTEDVFCFWVKIITMCSIECKDGGASGLDHVEGLIKFCTILIKNSIDVLTVDAQNVFIVNGKVNARVTPWGQFVNFGGGWEKTVSGRERRVIIAFGRGGEGFILLGIWRWLFSW